MAGQVLAAIQQVPVNDNAGVNQDLAQTASRLPPEMAAELLPRLLAWARSPYPSLLPETLAALVGRFAEAGQKDAALAAAALLDPALLDAEWCQNEYRHLLRARFPQQ